MNQSGLFSKKNPHYSFFSSRIMFPITDRQGKIQAFGGRIFPEGEIKYLNSAESDRYRKGHNLFALYTALPAIRKTKVAVLAEGYMDVIALHQADVTNAVAPLGTSFTDDQAKILARSASSVRFFFDADSAGQDATIRGILTCRRNGLSAEVIVPEHSLKDPAEILQKFDANVLKKNADHAIIDRDYFVSCAQSRYGGNSVEHKAQAVAFLFPYLQALNSEVMRDASIEAVAQAFSINPKFVSDDYKQYTDSPRADHRGIPPRPAVSIHTDDELSLLFAFAANPELYPQFRSQLSVDDFENPDARDIFLVLEDCFRSGAGIEMDTLLSCIRSEPLRNMLLQRIIKGEYSINPELFITDSINRLIERKLRRRLEEVQREMKSCPDETPQQQEKLNEFSELRLEIERLKNIGK
ncbi:hypothetical protein FACS1894164_00350 [Spirochaetia bacterium]|nr:hypothetical protein FACS1894164_00350 [Spirochaetia bacterium]